uniref:Uncharacterized protein n=1 Tax=Fagus sylvatica TaxID=28930 RepID=A0A2N9HNF3_FAGSY
MHRQAFFRCLSCLRHCPAATVRNPVACTAKKLIHRRTNLLPPSVLPLQDSDHEHLCSRWKDLEKLDPTAQESTPYDVGRVATCRSKFWRRHPRFSSYRTPIMTPLPPLKRSREARSNRARINLIGGRTRRHAPLKVPAPSRPFFTATSALGFIMTQSEISKPIHRRSNQKNYHLICAFCKHHGHTIDRCNMRAGILQRSAALTASESVPSSDAASFDPVSLTTPTYSIADLQALFSQVQALSSSASNSALSVTPGISSEWFLDSACCNYMTDNHHLTSAHTPPVLPTITTADGSAMTVSHVGSISTPNLSISDVFCVPKLHLNLLSVGQLTELGLNLFFSSRGCLVQDSRTGQIVGSARKVGRLFELTSLHFPSSSVSAPVIAASASIELWHSRLRRAERKLRHILDTVRALTNAASIPASFWGEAALTAVYTINQCPSPVIQNTTPYERALNFNPAPNYVVFLAMALKKRGTDVMIQSPSVFESLGMWLILYQISSLRFLPLLLSQLIPSPTSLPLLIPLLMSLLQPILPSTKSPLSAPAANPVNTTAPEPRRSHRVSTLPSHLRDFHCFSAFATLHEPHTFREASSDPLWQQAMKEELDALLKTGTWDLVDLPAGKSAIGCKWVYKIKTRSDGTVDRYKARLVAKGFTQEYGIDYEETFAPVARLSSVRTLIAVSASRHWPLFQMDVKNAFLNGELTEEVYMQLPPGFSQPPGFSHKVCRLRRALYGLKQAPRAWTSRILSTSLMVTISLKPSTHLILSLELGITDSKIVDTPIEYNNRLNTHDGEPLPDATLYRQLVGSLVYLTVTRSNISYAVHIVSQFMAAPRSLHYAAVLRILRYLKGTLFHGLHFSSQSSLTLQAYSDADWAGDPTDRRSTTGYCFLLGNSLISWRSKKQSVVARSSTEAEYRALADTTAELLWLRWLLQDLGIDCSTAVPIHCDNRSAIQIAHNDVFHERTKHIEIDCHFVRHHLLQGTLQLHSVSSQDQLADIFTKPMPPGRFRDLISKLKLVSLHPT